MAEEIPALKRNGTANVVILDVNRPWRHAKAPNQRTCIDFAESMRDLVDEHGPDTERIPVVLDKLSAHSAAALCQRFAPAEARRILSRLEFHFTPKLIALLLQAILPAPRSRS